MKILVFEYITGGGFNRRELPDSLSGEGHLMLDEVLACFSKIDSIELTVMLDWRICSSIDTSGINVAIIQPAHDTLVEYVGLARQCDAVWPIAPEFDDILYTLCRQVELLGKILLTSPAVAVAVTADKLKTYRQLSRQGIAAVATHPFEPSHAPEGEWMVKPVDGAGCQDSYLIAGPQDLLEVTQRLNSRGRYVMQPHLVGAKTSLSCLFKQGCGWLICANIQQFRLIGRQYQLTGIVVNYATDPDRYAGLVNAVAEAVPDLWGYAGIDLIETASGINVLEINPRLTTSFAGIYAALGINTCHCVLQLLDGDPVPQPRHNRSIAIKIAEENNAT